MIAKGERINDRYQIIGLIGEGGMANVYLAEDIILNRKVAVKVLRGDLASDDKFVRRFQREALSASSLSHPNIVEMYDVGEEGEQYYIVMEYVEGKTLKQLIKKRGAMTPTETVDIMLQLTSGLACAHDAYIIHRDIKPQNVLILENGLVKLTDFGIAMAMNNSQLTQTNSLLGSVHYLPPEQAGGKGSTMKSDIYSMGILMYEMLVGKIPFSGDNAVEIAMKQINDQIPSVRAINNKIPQSLENIIRRSTAKNPKNRYSDIKEMYDDLSTALDESRADEDLYVYRYQESDAEVKSQEKTKKIEPIAQKIEVGESMNQRKKLKILAFVLGALTLIAALIFVVMPSLTKVPDVRVPDVSGMSAVEAEAELRRKEFVIAEKPKLESSDTVAVGDVIGTDPSAGKFVKKGKEITLIISTGKAKVKIDNYVGDHIDDVQSLLEGDYGLVVVIKEKTVSLNEAANSGIILAQDPAAGKELTKGDKITLTISKLNDKIPNMVAEGWDLTMAQDFADSNGLKLVVREQESSTEAEGLIISQSLAAGTNLVRGQTLTIVIAVKTQEI